MTARPERPLPPGCRSCAWLVAACAAVWLPASVAAQQRPLVTEDPETIGTGRMLVEAGVAYDRALSIPVYGLRGSLWRVPAARVSVGLSSIAEFRVDAGYNRLHVTDRGPGPLAYLLDFTGNHTSSVQDVVLGTKVRIVPEGARRPSIAVTVATKLPNARNQTGLGTDVTDVSFTLLAGKTVHSVRIAGNVGVAIIGDPTQPAVQYDPTIFGVSLARALVGRVDVVGEVEGRWQAYQDSPPPAAENRRSVRGGLRYTRGTVRLDAGVSWGFGDIGPAFGVTTGVAWVFDAFRVP